MIERISPPGVPAPRGPYSPAVRAGDFIYVSGQGPVDPATDKLSPGDIRHETSLVLSNIKRILEACGATPADVEMAAALRVEPGQPVHHLVRVRLADGEPLMIERTTFPAFVGSLVADVDLDRQSIYAELANHGVVFARARQLDASPADARLLDVPRHAPLLRVRRHSFAPDGTALEWSDDRYRADRITLAVEATAPRAGMIRTIPDGTEG
jgi:hypothetical protein